MTPEEKAEELGKKYSTPCHGLGDCEFEAKQAALEMAQWKDTQICQFFNFVRPYLPAHIVAEAKKMLNIKH